MNVVSNNRIIIDAVAFFQYIGILSVVYFKYAFQHINEFFTFMCGKNKINAIFRRGNIDQERFPTTAPTSRPATGTAT